MKAILSGQAGLAVVLSTPPQFRPVNVQPYLGSEADIWPAFVGFTDVEELDVPGDDLKALDQLAERAWAHDRALYRLYMLFDDIESFDPALEGAVVAEFTALIRRFKIADEIEAWLDEVELGEEHQARALDIATRYHDLRDAMARLFPALQPDIERALRKAEDLRRERKRVTFERVIGRGKLPKAGKEFRYNTKKTPARPDNRAERVAREILQSILKTVVKSFGDTSHIKLPRSVLGRSSMLDKAAHIAHRDFNIALAKAGLSDEVEPYSVAQIRMLLRHSSGSSGIARLGSTARRHAGTKS